MRVRAIGRYKCRYSKETDDQYGYKTEIEIDADVEFVFADDLG